MAFQIICYRLLRTAGFKIGASELTFRRSAAFATMTQHSKQDGPIKFYNILPSPGACPYAQKSWIVLIEKGLTYETELIDPANKPQEFLDLYRKATSNPAARGSVPLIVDGDFILTESDVVSEYLDAKYDTPIKLLPKDPVELGETKLFLSLFNPIFAGSLMSASPGSVMAILRADSKEVAEQGTASLLPALKALNDFIVDHGKDDGDYFLGSKYSYAEAGTVSFLYRANVVLKHFRDYDLLATAEAEGLDRFVRWAKAAFARPSTKATLPSDESIVEVYSRFIKKIE